MTIEGFFFFPFFIACEIFSSQECSSNKSSESVMDFLKPSFYASYGNDILKELTENMGP